MSDAKIGYGAQFHMHDGASPGVMTKLAEVFDVSPPDQEIDDVECTHYESANRTNEYIAGFINPGMITVEMNYIGGSTTDDLIVAAKNAGDVRNMKVVIPASPKNQEFTFPGIVKGYKISTPVKDRQTATMTIRVSGAVTQADAA